MVLGRVAAMIGNVIFPLLLEAGCAPPFIVVGSLLIGMISNYITNPGHNLRCSKCSPYNTFTKH
jgi:hypothetical protein